MKTKCKIASLDLDYQTHKPKLTLVLENQELIGYDEIKDLEELDLELTKPKRKRSLNANSYIWVLIQKLADKLGSTKEDIYKNIIKEKGIFQIMTVNNEAIKTLQYSWNNNGLGFISEVLSKGKSMSDVILYYGSSVYNSKQMANLIDYVVEECKEQDIETMTPIELETLKNEWGK